MCKGICFPDCWKVSSKVPALQNIRERSKTKSCYHISLLILSITSGNLAFFSDIQYNFNSHSTADLLTVSVRVSRVFNMCGSSSFSTWYTQCFRQSFAWWSSRTWVLCSLRSGLIRLILSYLANGQLRCSG